MGQQIILQPDGKLCVFSTVEGAFILMDESPDDLINFYGVAAATKAREQTARIIKLVLDGRSEKYYHRLGYTYAEAAALDKKFHG